jgi:hypothetical protein
MVAYFSELRNFSSTFEVFERLYSASTLLPFLPSFFLFFFFWIWKGKWDAYEGWLAGWLDGWMKELGLGHHDTRSTEAGHRRTHTCRIGAWIFTLL